MLKAGSRHAKNKKEGGYHQLEIHSELLRGTVTGKNRLSYYSAVGEIKAVPDIGSFYIVWSMAC